MELGRATARARPRPRPTVREQREDRREVGPGRAREPQAVLLRAGVGALVRADPAGAVVLDPHAREEPAAGARLAVGAGVVLLERPERGPARPGRRRPRARHCASSCGGVRVRVAVALRQVDADDVVRRARLELGPLLGVDHVVGRRDDVAAARRSSRGRSAARAGARSRPSPAPEATRPALAVVPRSAATGLPQRGETRLSRAFGAWRSLVARRLWVAEVPGSNPGAPMS